MECAQLQITGGGSTSPATVSFPGAYHSKQIVKCGLSFQLTDNIGTDPGIKIDIYQTLANYTIPGISCLHLLKYIHSTTL